MNVDQIYSYLLKLKLNLCIWPNSNYKTLSIFTKNKCFHFVKGNLVSSIGKNSPFPTRKPNDLAAPNKKSKLESSPPHLIYQVQQQNLKDALIL